MHTANNRGCFITEDLQRRKYNGSIRIYTKTWKTIFSTEFECLKHNQNRSILCTNNPKQTNTLTNSAMLHLIENMINTPLEQVRNDLTE